MGAEEDRCAEAAKHRRIDEAFRNGDLEALRAAVDDPAAIPNGQMPITIGSCLVYAIYRSPLAFIRTLLEIGADPRAPVGDGFPPLIAALSCSRAVPGSTARSDVDDTSSENRAASRLWREGHTRNDSAECSADRRNHHPGSARLITDS